MFQAVTFGKHKGKSLPQIVFNDPDWFFWACENQIFTGELAVEAADLQRKATSIKAPSKNGVDTEVEYLLHPVSKKLAAVDVVPKSQPLHSGSGEAFRRDVIDLSVPRQVSKFDKLGGKIIVAKLKAAVFQDPRTKLTKQRCEEFFENETNFK
jgi:hypothetical protein